MIHKPTDPAFPVSTGTNPGSSAAGLTIRAHFAAMAMQGILASGNDFPTRLVGGAMDKDGIPTGWVADLAARYADALIAELNK